MWYKNENGENVKPNTLDKTSSKAYVYIRKEFVYVPSTDEIPSHWSWMEAKIPKSEWEIYAQVMGQEAALNDVFDAIAELGELFSN